MGLQQQSPAFNLARSPIVTKERYAESDFVLLMQFLLTQAVRAIPTVGTFLDLPVATFIGQQAVITDSSTNAWGDVIAGSGAFAVLGIWTGANWTVMGKKA